MSKVNGNGGGLPFYAFLNPKGDLIVNSKKDGQDNVGYPNQPEEISWFMTMLIKAAPNMDQSERQIIDDWLRNQKK